MLEVIIIKRRKAWEWRVRDQVGATVATGRAQSRPAARYNCYRAMFALLASGWKSTDMQLP